MNILDQLITPEALAQATAQATATECEYLKGRGFNEATAAWFKLGQYRLGNYGQRLWIPLIGQHGQIISFAARTLGENQPKYINGKDSQWYHKSDFVYNAFTIVEQFEQVDKLLIVEGYADVWRVHQSVPDMQAVAIGGTALTPNQLVKVLFTYLYVDAVPVLAFDNDRAGKEATLRALRLIADHCPQNFNDFYVLDLASHSSAKDVDEYIQFCIADNTYYGYPALENPISAQDYLIRQFADCQLLHEAKELMDIAAILLKNGYGYLAYVYGQLLESKSEGAA